MCANGVFEGCRTRGQVRRVSRVQVRQLSHNSVQVVLSRLTSEREVSSQVSQGTSYARLRFVESCPDGVGNCRGLGLPDLRLIQRCRGLCHSAGWHIADLREAPLQSGHLVGVALLAG